MAFEPKTWVDGTDGGKAAEPQFTEEEVVALKALAATE